MVGAVAFVGVILCVIAQQVPRLVGKVQVISPGSLVNDVRVRRGQRFYYLRSGSGLPVLMPTLGLGNVGVGAGRSGACAMRIR